MKEQKNRPIPSELIQEEFEFAWEEDLRSVMTPYITSPSHGWEHIHNVMDLAGRIYRKYGGDLEVIKAAVYLHDAGRHDSNLHGDDSVQESVRVANNLLDNVNFPPNKKKLVLEAISQHDDSTGPEPDTLEAKILGDADKLDGIGAIGVIRASMHTGEVRQNFYKAIERLKVGMRKRIDKLYFSESREIALKRYEIVQRLLDQLSYANNQHIGSRESGTSGTHEILQERAKIIENADIYNLKSQIRQVTQLNDRTIRPYQDAQISFASIPLAYLNPSSKYLLKNQLKVVDRLRNDFLHQGVDIMNMPKDNAFFKFQWGNKERIMLPPIAEYSEDDDGMLVIVDGGHRIKIARKLGLDNVRMLVIKDAATPLPVKPVSWDRVEEVTVVPSAEQKRDYRFSSARDVHLWRNENIQRFLTGVDQNQGTGYYTDFRDFGSIQI